MQAMELPAKKQIKYEYVETASGVWKRYVDLNGRKFAEYRSNANLFGVPLLSVASGLDPETNRMAQANGIVAIGQRAKGLVAIGQFCSGYVAVGQFAVGRVAAIGQFSLAPVAVGQFSFGFLAVAQIGAAGWGLFSIGISLADRLGPALERITHSLPQVF